MKKTILKTSFIIVCIGLIIFLLLPFLETQPPATTSLHATQPQLVSSNPLAAIAKRLGALFGRKGEHKPSLQPHPATATQELLAGNKPRFAGQADETAFVAGKQPDLAETASVSSTETDEMQPSFKTDDGEWVLIRQVAPHTSEPGMHEVNVHDNPYDRYVRQERANHVRPRPAPPQIPDSKWARLMRPIKEFFGMESPQPTQTARLAIASQSEGVSSATSDKLAGQGHDSRTGLRTRVPFPDVTPQQWLRMTPQEQEQERQRHAMKEFADLLTGNQVAEDAAAISANAKYPNPQTEAEKKQKEAYQKRLTEENKQKIRDGLLAAMQENAANKESVDEIGNLLNCTNSSLPSRSCSTQVDPDTGHPLPPAPLSDDEIAAGQAKNTADFQTKTGFVLPQNLPITVVFGPTDPKTMAELTNYTDDNPEVKRAAELYDFLFKQQDCANQDCFWVTNSPQLDQQMTQVWALNTAQLKEDPLGVYPPLEPKFVDYKVAQMQEQLEKMDADEETQKKMLAYAREDAKKQFHENAPHLVAYKGEQITQMQHNSFAAIDRNNPQADPSQMTIIFVGNAKDAPKVSEYTGPYITYHRNTMSDAQNVPQGGEQVNDSLAANVNTTTDVSHQILGDAVQGNAQSTVQNINRIIGQNNDSGKGLSGLLDAFGNKRSGK